MKFVALVSGGKDSIYSIMECIKNGHELIGCVHLAAPDVTEEESYMYQTAGSEVIQTLVEECLGVPLILQKRIGKSINTSLVYENTTNDTTSTNSDEVEDLYIALKKAKEQFPNIQGISSGAILSTYQRTRIENVCNRLNLTSLSYLWRYQTQMDLLQLMITSNIEAILVRTACPPGLVPRKHLNKSIDFLHNTIGLFPKLHKLYQFHVCGEGGEYETIVLDAPIYKKRLILDEYDIIESDDDYGVGYLKIQKCHAEDKDMKTCINDNSNKEVEDETNKEEEEAQKQQEDEPNKTKVSTRTSDKTLSSSEKNTSGNSIIAPPSIHYLPHVCKGTGGFLYVSEIMAPIAAAADTTTTTIESKQESQNDNEAQLAVQEFLQILIVLKSIFKRYDVTSNDVIFVHLYLSEMSHFKTINTHYCNFFGTTLPPSRSCVAIGKHVLTGNRRVLFDCIIQCGSGKYMRKGIGYDNNSSSSSVAKTTKSSINDQYATAASKTMTSKLREVLHVQSISYWAPVCVGPYSQVNTIRSGLHYLAGQIGLIPSKMILQNGWKNQLQQCWTNIASVLDALNTNTNINGSLLSLEQLVSGLIYVTNDVYNNNNKNNTIQDDIKSISHTQIKTNGGIISGRIDNYNCGDDDDDNSNELYGGYEDEGTWLEMKQLQEQKDVEKEINKINYCPLLLVSIPELPVGALIELEVISLTNDSLSCLDMTDKSIGSSCSMMNDNIPYSRNNTHGWDTGHDYFMSNHHHQSSSTTNDNIQITTVARIIGKGCAASIIVTASMNMTRQEQEEQPLHLNSDIILKRMLQSVDKILAEGRSHLNSSNTMNIRLYYIATSSSSSSSSSNTITIDDGTQLRSSLKSMISSWRRKGDEDDTCLPASTIVPVNAISLLLGSTTTTKDKETKDDDNNNIKNDMIHTFFAMQVLVVDPVHMETEIWIRKNRDTL